LDAQIAAYLGTPTKMSAYETGLIQPTTKPDAVTTFVAKHEPEAVKVADPIPVAVEATPEVVADTTGDAIPYATVRDAVLKLALAKGKPRVLELLAQFGAEKKADEIDPSRFGEVLDTINKLLEE
jgi:hypothetical protein